MAFQMETFKCSCTERGRRCENDFTRANAFTYSLDTLKRKRGVLTLKAAADNAICPFRARFLQFVRKDVLPMGEVVAQISALQSEGRRQNAERLRRRTLVPQAPPVKLTTMEQAFKAAMGK